MKKISEKMVFEGKWLSVHETVYEGREGKLTHWESIKRKRSTVGVIVLAKFKHSGEVILIKQYRPAINGYILSLPAGLGFNDPNQALVELKEETGYVGVIADVSPVLKTGASLLDDNAMIVCVDVDEKSKANLKPHQELEAGEEIEVVLVHPKKAKEFILSQEKDGVHVAANLWYLFGIGNWFFKDFS